MKIKHTGFVVVAFVSGVGCSYALHKYFAQKVEKSIDQNINAVRDWSSESLGIPVQNLIATKWRKVVATGILKGGTQEGGIYSAPLIDANIAVCEDGKIYSVERFEGSQPNVDTSEIRWIQNGYQFTFREPNKNQDDQQCVFVKTDDSLTIQIKQTSQDIKRQLCDQRDEQLLRSRKVIHDSEKIVRCVRLERPNEPILFKLITFEKDKCFARYPTFKNDHFSLAAAELGEFKPNFSQHSFCVFREGGGFFEYQTEEEYASLDRESDVILINVIIGSEQFKLVRGASGEGLSYELLHQGKADTTLESIYLYLGYDVAPAR